MAFDDLDAEISYLMEQLEGEPGGAEAAIGGRDSDLPLIERASVEITDHGADSVQGRREKSREV